MLNAVSRAAVVAASAISVVALSGGSASAEACSDPVATTLHTVHEATGDPAGLGHTAEETYCGVKP